MRENSIQTIHCLVLVDLYFCLEFCLYFLSLLNDYQIYTLIMILSGSNYVDYQLRIVIKTGLEME